MSTSPRAIFADGSVLLCSIVSLVQSLDFLLELFSNAVDFLLVLLVHLQLVLIHVEFGDLHQLVGTDEFISHGTLAGSEDINFNERLGWKLFNDQAVVI